MIDSENVSIPIQSVTTFANEVQATHDRITKRAYERFIERGAVHGHDLDDWLAAENELIVKPLVEITEQAHDIIVEMALTDIDPSGLLVCFTPTALLIRASIPYSDRPEQELFQVVPFPKPVDTEGADAGLYGDLFRLRAALAEEGPEESKFRFQVA